VEKEEIRRRLTPGVHESAEKSRFALVDKL
jgi:hypothetical protein